MAGEEPVIRRRTALCVAFILCLLAAGAALQPAAAQFADIEDQTAAAPAEDGGAAAALLSADELREVVAPVAFYPDDLLAVVLPAATQPLQLVEAARFLEKQKTAPDLKPNENWDPAVLALLNYPEVIQLMNDDLEWTQRLGNAVMDQQKDVMDAIQAARSSATAAGYLESNDKQTVVKEEQTIIIKSADPEVIYVPSYDPAPVVQNTYVNYPPPAYSTPYPYYYAPGATFVAGMFVGAAFSYAFDWHDHDIDIDCCEGGGTTNNINIGSGNTNIDRDKLQNKFNGDRNPKAKGGNGMTWSPQKARGKSSAPRPATRQRPSSAAVAKQLGGAGGKKITSPTTKSPAQTRRDSKRGSQSLGTNKQQRQQQFKQPQKPKPSQMQQRRQQQKYNQMQYKPKKGSFSSMPSQRQTRSQSNRGHDSIGGSRSRPNRRR
jgi:hypothetical protein